MEQPKPAQLSKLTASRCMEEYDLNSASAIFNLVPECLCSYKCKVSLLPLLGGREGSHRAQDPIGADTSRLSFKRVVFLTSGKLQTKPQYSPSLVKNKRKR